MHKTKKYLNIFTWRNRKFYLLTLFNHTQASEWMESTSPSFCHTYFLGKTPLYALVQVPCKTRSSFRTFAKHQVCWYKPGSHWNAWETPAGDKHLQVCNEYATILRIPKHDWSLVELFALPSKTEEREANSTKTLQLSSTVNAAGSQLQYNHNQCPVINQQAMAVRECQGLAYSLVSTHTSMIIRVCNWFVIMAGNHQNWDDITYRWAIACYICHDHGY